MSHRSKRTIVASGDYKSVDPSVVTLNTAGERNLRIGVDVTDISGSGATVTVTISGVDASGVLYTLLSKAITGSGLTEMVVSPGVVAATGTAAQQPLPETVKVACVGSGTRTTLTYAVSAESD